MHYIRAMFVIICDNSYFILVGVVLQVSTGISDASCLVVCSYSCHLYFQLQPLASLGEGQAEFQGLV